MDKIIKTSKLLVATLLCVASVAMFLIGTKMIMETPDYVPATDSKWSLHHGN